MTDELKNSKAWNSTVDFLKDPRLYGPPIFLCLLLGAALFWWHASLVTSGPRAFVAYGIAGFVLWFSFPGRGYSGSAGDASSTAAINTALDASYVRNFIAYDAIVFTVVGLATAVAAASQWETAILLSGTCLLTGAFFGLLFGYPQGVAQSAPTQSGRGPNPSVANAVAPENLAADEDAAGVKDNRAVNGTLATQRDTRQTVLAQASSTLGTLIAGFSLAKAGNLIPQFHRLCDAVAPALVHTAPDKGFVLAGVIILYFFATGFFSGLLLPSYFMGGKFG